MTRDKDPRHTDPRHDEHVTPADTRPDNTAFHVKLNAQENRMAGQKNVQNPQVLHRANQPNAGGQNRESGDRRARQNDRATNGGE